MNRRKKIALLVATVQSHIGQFHKPLMRMLKEAGWEIHVAAQNNLAEKDTLQLEYPDMVFDVPFRRSPLDLCNLTAFRELNHLLKEYRYDIIHCNTPVGGILTRLAAKEYRKQGTKVFYTAHGFHFYKGAPLKNWMLYYPLEKFFSNFTDILITINKEDFALANKKFNCPIAHIHGVGADSVRYYPLSPEQQEELKRQLGLSGHILLSTGELLPNKNQKTAILTLKEILKSVPDTHLLIAGNGSERTNLEALINRENLTDHVTFLGYTRNLPRYMQICDMEISCSYREGLPLNIVEAMLCGKPVVASHNRGHDELVQEGVNGFLVDPDDSKSYAEMFCRVLSGSGMDRNAIIKSAELYTDYNVSKELAAIYLSEERN